MNEAVKSGRATGMGPGSRIVGALAIVASSFVWALEMRRRYSQELAGGWRLEDGAIRRIIEEIDADHEQS